MLKKIVHKYKNSEFLVNVTKLGSATTIAQFISIGTAPLLYRIYDKSDYGTLGLFIAITGVIGVFSTLQYLQTILLEKNDEEAINAMWLNRIINLGFTIVCSLVLFSFRGNIQDITENKVLEKWLWLIPFSIFFSGQGEIFKVWANRKKEYTIITINTILLSLVVPLVSITLGLIFKSEIGLFIGLFSGQFISAMFMVILMNLKYDIGYRKFNFEKIKILFAKHKAFPIFSLPSEFVNRFTNQLPVFMLNTYLGPSTVGVYNLATRMLGLPIQLIGGAISTVFQQKATNDYNTFGSCRPIFLKTLKTLSLIAVIPTLVILFFGPDLFSFVFGSKWSDAGHYARVLILLFSGKLIVSPLSYLFFIAGKQHEDFYWHIWMLISNVLVFKLTIYFQFSIINILLSYSVNYMIIYIIYVLRSFSLSQNESIDKA
jgi:O-antigen/teichoic acid export membrane protein